MNNNAAGEYRANNCKRHNLIGKKCENTRFNEKPVVAPVVDGIAEGCPHKDHQNAHKFLPDLADVIDNILVGKVQHAPADDSSHLRAPQE